ncbi:MAG: hypothetical protein U9R47_07775 [Actinomycetota bacterium]|nr:hypothetical protein [Actinomycetota bacterium]
MRKTLLTGLVVGLLTIVMAVPALASNGKSGDSNGRSGSTLTITVTGGDYDVVYDSIVKADLPMKGRFQQLIPTDDGLVTEFGPGDHDYVGGRWWVDVNEDGEMNGGDAFFLCPLLGPGRSG